MSVAVDAMGGDRAPEEIVLGAVEAVRRGAEVVLVGDPGRLRPLLDDVGADLPIEPASEVVAMGEDPSRAVREKKDSSVMVAARLVADGRSDGFVSAGSTGAAMAAAAFVVGRLPGVARPAIASMFPTGQVLIDAGANLEVRPEHLLQFAVMGSALGQVRFGLERPRVGLLNIGEEPGKGRPVEREAYELLKASPVVEFVGNVEGRDVGRDTVDVIVTDGFTGNILLKTSEGVSRFLYHAILEALSDEAYQDALAALMPAFLGLRRRLDPENVGGAYLLGVRGVVVIAHGSSSRVAIANAVEMADEGARFGLVPRIADGLAATAS